MKEYLIGFAVGTVVGGAAVKFGPSLYKMIVTSKKTEDEENEDSQEPAAAE